MTSVYVAHDSKPDAQGIVIRTSDRCCFFGRTESGKTTLARALLRGFTRWVVLDPKHTYREQGVDVVRSFQPDMKRQIVRVPFENEQNEWMNVIYRAWRRKNNVIYVDETNMITPARTIAKWYGNAIRTGRERNVAVWSASQRPKEVPSVVFTEAEHFFVFQLIYAPDREKVASFTGDKILPLLEELKSHEFVYYNVKTNQMHKMILEKR